MTMSPAKADGQAPAATASPPAAPPPSRPASPPSEEPRREEAREKPRFGLFRRIHLTLALIWYAYWNLPGLRNILQALKLAKTRQCTIIGYKSKMVFAYPLIPLGITLAILFALGVPGFPLAVVYAFAIVWTLIVIAEDIRGRSAWAVLGFTVAGLAIYFALWYTGVDVNGYIRDALGKFAPEINGGLCLMISTLLLPLVILAHVRAKLDSVLKVQGNTFVSKTLETTLDYPIEDWRLRSRISDILEMLWMGGRELMLISNFGAGRRGVRSTEDAAEGREEFHLPNVPGGWWVEFLTLQAIATKDVTETGELGDED